MVEPLELASQRGDKGIEELATALKHQVQLADRLPNAGDRLSHLEEVLSSYYDLDGTRYSDDAILQQIVQDAKDVLFDLRSVEELLGRIEHRLGQGASDPVDLSLQQTLDVVQQLRQLSVTIPNDERLASLATNVCEGLESFVSSVLVFPQSDQGAEGPVEGASPSDLTLALDIMETIRTCPGGDRTAVFKSLRQQFLDAACHSAWSRVDKLFDLQLDRATRKEYLHQALTIWTLLPDLSENAGSPRLSQLPEEIHRTVQEVLLRGVTGSVEVGNLSSLRDAALLAKELADEYLTMIPAISVPDAQSALGLQASASLVRRIRTELLSLDSRQDLELCLSTIAILRTIPALEQNEPLNQLTRPIVITKWRLRFRGLVRFVRRFTVLAFIGLIGVASLTAAYIGLTILIQRLYEFNMPFAP